MHRAILQAANKRLARLPIAALIAALILLPLASSAAAKQLASPHGLHTNTVDLAADQDHASHCNCAHGQQQSCCDGSDEAGGCDLCGLSAVTVPSERAVVSFPASSWDAHVRPSRDGLTIPPETKPPIPVSRHRSLLSRT